MAGSPYRVDASTQMLGWDSTLRAEAGTQDVFSDFSGIYTDNQKNVGDAITVKVKAKAGEHYRTISLLRPLSGAGVTGRTSQMGNEETQVVRNLKLYANTYSNGVIQETYGIDQHDASYLGVVEKIQPAESRWHKEMAGKHMREAICENYSAHLTDAPISLTAGINSNIMFIDTTLGSTKVTYDSTKADYITAIDAAADAAPSSEHRLSQTALNHIIKQCEDSEIEQIMIDGRPSWILTVGTRQKAFLMAAATSGYNNLLEQADVRGKDNRALSYIMGRYGPLVLVSDPRSPTVTVTGSVFTVGYKGAGTTDGRTMTAANTLFDINMVLGKNALFQFDAQELAFKEEVQDYGKIKGLAAVRTTGWVSGQYDDLVSPTDSTMVNKSSMLVLTGTN